MKRNMQTMRSSFYRHLDMRRIYAFLTGLLFMACFLTMTGYASSDSKKYTGEQASEAMLAYCQKYVSENGVSYVLDEYEEENGSAYIMWFHCYTGVTMKLEADLMTGDVVESGPYQGKTPHSMLPMSSDIVFNLGDKAETADTVVNADTTDGDDIVGSETDGSFVIKIDPPEEQDSIKTPETTTPETSAPPAPAPAPSPGIDLSKPFYLLPQSDRVEITWDMISDMSMQQWNYARNEIFARHGRKFLSKELMDYFTSQNWYHGTIEPQSFTDDMLSALELKNALYLSGLEYADGVGYVLDREGYDITKVYPAERLEAMKAAKNGGSNSGNKDVGGGQDAVKPDGGDQLVSVSAADAYRQVLADGVREYQNNERRSNLQIAFFAVIDLDGNGTDELLLTDSQQQTVIICGFGSGKVGNITFDYSCDPERTFWDEARHLLVFPREKTDQREDYAILKISGNSSVRGYLTKETDSAGNQSCYVDDKSVSPEEYEKRYNSIFTDGLKSIPFVENTEENRQAI